MSDIYQVGHLERVPLGTPYPGIVAHVGRLLGKFPNPELIIDYTGVGRPVFDLFTYAGISPVGVLITGGAVETRYGATCGVPKLTLVSRLQALLHQGQLKIQKELSEAETLVRELQDFRVEFTATGHLTFNARAGKHDDLVLARDCDLARLWRRDPVLGRFRSCPPPRCRSRRSSGHRAALFRRGRPRAKPRPDGDRGSAAGRARRSGRCGGGWPKPRAHLRARLPRVAASAGAERRRLVAGKRRPG